MIKAVLFDLDGTLVDTLQDLADSVNVLLRENGLPTHPLDAYRAFIGDGAKVLVERASGRKDEAMEARFLEEYDRRCLDKAVPYEGVLETLDVFKARGIRVGIVTNKPHAQAVKIAEHLLKGRYDCLFGNQPHLYPRKPDPTVLRMAAEAMGVSIEECVFVGDSNVDVFSAHNAGIPCYGCAFGFRGEDELRRAGADEIVYSFIELQKIG